jgi:sugar phosphate isomerase/epimerase
MRFAICNELFGQTEFHEICHMSADLGYQGIEIAPFTLADTVHDLLDGDRRAIRRMAESHGLEVVGLHWLLVKPEGLHLTTPDEALRARTRAYLLDLVQFCADLGGKIMVCGSPRQRTVLDNYQASWQRAVTVFREVADAAGERGITFCIEPLSPTETDFLTCAEDALKMVKAVDHPSFQMILDIKAMAGGERDPLPAVVARAKDHVRHIHANDPNLLGPGMGGFDHGPVGDALRGIGYEGWVSVEVFRFELEGYEIARRSLEGLERWYGPQEAAHE